MAHRLLTTLAPQGVIEFGFLGGSLPPAFTCTRVNATAGASTQWDANGTLVDVPDNVAAWVRMPADDFATIRGLLVERGATNFYAVTNAPVLFAETMVGLTLTNVGSGTEDGMPYTDYRINGIATSTSTVQLRTASTTTTGSVIGTAVSGSAFVKFIAGTPVANGTLRLTEAAGAYPSSNSPVISKTETKLSKARYAATRIKTVATTLHQVRLWFPVTNATAYDFTIRVAHPQIEIGNWATMPIRTSGAAATRVSDLVTLNPATFGISSFKNISMWAEYELLGTVNASTTSSQSDTQHVLTMTAGANNQAGLTARTHGSLSEVLKGASSLSGGSTASSMFFQHDADTTVGQVLRLAARFKDGDCAAACTGNASIIKPATFTQTATTPTELCIGNNGSFDLTGALSGAIRRIVLMPNRNLSDAELLALVA